MPYIQAQASIARALGGRLISMLYVMDGPGVDIHINFKRLTRLKAVEKNTRSEKQRPNVDFTTEENPGRVEQHKANPKNSFRALIS